MKDLPKEGKIIAYINPAPPIFPFPVITIYENQGQFFVRWPAGTSQKLEKINSISNIPKKEQYYFETKDKTINAKDYSYMFAPNTVLTDSPENIKSQLEQALQTGINPISKEKIPKKDYRLLKEFFIHIDE
ncbi:MAG TPA: hypothetical protein VJB35_02225 [Candidatus Nanoarchaeia archaeon]|nr:hypothetical protein [Candidatus Nanoarchaeia archaeon]